MNERRGEHMQRRRHLTNKLRGRGILRRLARKPVHQIKTKDPAIESQCFALRKIVTDRRGGELPTRSVRVKHRALDLAEESFRQIADGGRRDQNCTGTIARRRDA